jgi:hypothetical protein
VRLLCLLGVSMLAFVSGHAHAQDGGGGEGGEGGADDGLPLPSVTALADALKVVRGAAVILPGERLPKASAITVRLGGQDIGHPIAVAKDQKSLVFVVPDGSKGPPAPLGTWPLEVKISVVTPESPPDSSVDFTAGSLRVVAEDPTPELKLNQVNPPVVAPDTKRVLITGEGFVGRGEDYALLRDGLAVPLCWEGSAPKDCSDTAESDSAAAKTPASPSTEPCCTRARFNSSYELELIGPFGASWRGLHDLTLRRGTVESKPGKAPAKLRFIAHTRDQIRNWSLSASAAVLGLLLLLVISNRGTRREIRAPGGAARVVSTLFLDAETDTYSLGKCQLLAWLVAGLFSYAYLTLARALGQGIADIADVPANLPYMLLLSGGTTMVSVGITNSKGPKGAGAIHPSLSDLVSSGGVISAERLGYAMWTFVAIATYLFTVFRADPTTLDGLPGIPDRLLALQGVAAAAYLGGKGARSAGPVIDEIAAVVMAGGVQLSLLGRNLHTNATVQILNVSIAPFLDPAKHPNGRPNVLKPDPTTGFGSGMTGLLIACAPEWLDKDALDVTVVNPDGQAATWSLAVDDTLKEQLKLLPPSLGSARPPKDDAS